MMGEIVMIEFTSCRLIYDSVANRSIKKIKRAQTSEFWSDIHSGDVLAVTMVSKQKRR